MQSAAKREEYRRMTPSERLRITFDLIEEGWAYLNVGTPEQIRRKYERIKEQNDLFNRACVKEWWCAGVKEELP